MSRQVSTFSGRPYGLARVSRVWGIARATVYRFRHPSSTPARRPGPCGPMPDAALVEAIRRVLTSSGFHGEGYRKVWARLRFAGIRTSRRRVLRLMREHGLLAHQRQGAACGPRSHDGTITTEQVDTMWGADFTTILTGEGQAACGELARAALTVTPQSSRSIIARPSAWASMRHATQPALKPWSQSGKASASTSAPSGTRSPAGSPSGTIMAASTWPTTSRRNSLFSASRARRPLSERRRAMAVPSGSSAP
jgi:HTH-like domain